MAYVGPGEWEQGKVTIKDLRVEEGAGIKQADVRDAAFPCASAAILPKTDAFPCASAAIHARGCLAPVLLLSRILAQPCTCLSADSLTPSSNHHQLSGASTSSSGTGVPTLKNPSALCPLTQVPIADLANVDPYFGGGGAAEPAVEGAAAAGGGGMSPDVMAELERAKARIAELTKRVEGLEASS